MWLFIDAESFNNNNFMTTNFNSFSDDFFVEHPGFPPVVTFLSHFYQKTSVEANVHVAAIFALYFLRNCSQFVICDNCVYLIDL